jgi:ADP-ribosyl-[dinitrogen reductase] hydrolase
VTELTTDVHDRARGALVGLACGDALGRPVEFMPPADIEREHGTVTEMLGHGTHNQPAGTVTDDTEMMLCIARSLTYREAFEPEDVARRYVEWLASGPFDVGLMTRDAIRELERDAPPDVAGKRMWERRQEGANAGNGSLMCCVPYALAFAHDVDSLVNTSRESSRITHYDQRCQDACVAFNAIVVAQLTDRPVTDLLSGYQLHDDVRGVVDRVLSDDLLDESTLQNTGYVVHTLETSLHDALTSESAERAIVRSVNRGGDTDTLGAVTGALAGSRFGLSALPDRWLTHINEVDELNELADQLITTDFPAVR